MSHSPETSQTDRASLQDYQDRWEAIYNLIDEGSSWSGGERNCAFLNLGGERFADISSACGLDFPDDGRAVAVVDWDFDGRLDFWTTNRTAPRVRLLHNSGEQNNGFVAFRLQGTTCNRDAIGARLELHLPDGETQLRTVHAGDGYLAQSTRWVHFGTGASKTAADLIVHWPGGPRESFGPLATGTFYSIRQGSGTLVEWQAPREQLPLEEALLPVPRQPSNARTWVLGRVPFPAENYRSWTGDDRSLAEFRDRPLLLNLWSRNCAPCLSELEEWRHGYGSLTDNGKAMQILTLCVDDDPKQSPLAGAPFASGVASPELIDGVETIHRALLESRRSLPVPTSVLLDADGLVAAIYKGPLSLEDLRKDLSLLDAPLEEQRMSALPFPGRFGTQPLSPMPRPVIGTLMKAGKREAARSYTLRLLAGESAVPLAPPVRASLALFAGDLHLDDGELDEAVTVYARLFEIAPRNFEIHREVGVRLVTKQRVKDAIRHLTLAVALKPSHVDSRLNLATLQMREGMFSQAAANFGELVNQQPGSATAHFYLANTLEEIGETRKALTHYQASHRLKPSSQASVKLAWILATHPDDSLRDGPAALDLAGQVCQASQFRNPVHLHTLAVACAETGDFQRAIAMAERALTLAEALPSAQGLSAQVGRHLQEFRAGRPVRE